MKHNLSETQLRFIMVEGNDVITGIETWALTQQVRSRYSYYHLPNSKISHGCLQHDSIYGKTNCIKV